MLSFETFIKLEEMIKHEGDEWVVYDSEGKDVLGRHKTKKEAIDQIAAIEISKAKH